MPMTRTVDVSLPGVLENDSDRAQNLCSHVLEHTTGMTFTRNLHSI